MESTSVMQQQDFFAMNPLEDPVVRSTLEQIQMTGRDLINVTVKDLNKRLTGCPHSTISKLKKCRRTLKNRGYAKNCRIKRLCLRNELELTNAKLRAEINELRVRNKLLQSQINELQQLQPSQKGCSTNIAAAACQLRRSSQGATTGTGHQATYYNHHQSVQQQDYAMRHHHPQQQQPPPSTAQAQCHGGYSNPSNLTHDDNQVQYISQNRHIYNSSNDSPISSSSCSSIQFNMDYGSFDDEDFDFSYATNNHGQDFSDNSNWEPRAQVQDNVYQQQQQPPRQLIGNQVNFN